MGALFSLAGVQVAGAIATTAKTRKPRGSQEQSGEPTGLIGQQPEPPGEGTQDRKSK
jgi:hypothetical protein